MNPVNQDEPEGEDPYASLFRPPEPEPELAEIVEVVSQPEPEPEPVQTSSETGRVFKSLGVLGHEEALIAIPAHKAGKLRTLTRDSQHHTDVIPVTSSPDSGSKQVGPPSPRVRNQRARETQTGTARPGFIGSLSAPWVYAITIGVTFIFGLGDVLIFGGLPGFLSGLGLLLATIFVSFAVRQSDDIHVIYAPAIAFFLMAITIGQLNVTSNSLIDRFIEVFFSLGRNWIWILGSTAFALTVVAVRRRSLR